MIKHSHSHSQTDQELSALVASTAAGAPRVSGASDPKPDLPISGTRP